jgi:8-amino-7-oxononanoate synthase
MTTPIERRNAVRWELAGDKPIKFFSEQEALICDIINISEYGLQLQTNFDPPLGYIFDIKILSDEDSLGIDVKVIWKKEVTNDRHQIGVLVSRNKNFEKFQNFVSTASKVVISQRRLKERRMAVQTSQNFPEKRSNERRGAPSLTLRAAQASASLDRWIATNTYRRVVQSGAGPTVLLRSKPKIMLGSNNYLGLTEHPKVKEAAIKAVEKYGTGSGGVRWLTGTTELHKRLEEKLAKFTGSEDCLIFPSGYLTNVAAITSLVKDGDVVLNDATNHASIIDGCRATKGIIRFYKHSDLMSLERKLKQYNYSKSKLIITDGVFSMDGDIAPIPEIHALAKKYNAMLMLDDAHATGVIGTGGRGTAEHFNMLGKPDLITVTLSKALPGIGGAICGSNPIIKYITNHSRQIIFSSSMPPSVCASIIAGIEVIETEPQIIVNLHKNRDFLYKGLKNLGFNVIETPTAILPVIIGQEVTTYKLTALLEDMGVFANAVSRPAVPRELSRLRICVMATHTSEQLQEALHVFQKSGKQLGII